MYMCIYKVLRSKNMNPNYHVYCCVIDVLVIVAFGLNRNVSCEGLLKGGGGD